MPNTRGRSRGSHPKPFTTRSTPTPIGRVGSSIVRRGREIANEWSLRGRGNNSSSGNDMDIPDECSPIGRGSNNSRNDRGRADDCSPRGRRRNNTSGNGRGKADDCSPRGRGSSSIGGRSNESVDEWCPSLDIFGDERLDVHEDNEEHMEHVVGSSQNQVGLNVTPLSSLPKLWLVGGVFYDPAISRHAIRLFKTMFKGAYATWTKVPQDHRDRRFNHFGTFYRWEDAESNQIRDAWESHMKNRYSDIMRSVRKAAMKAIKVNDNVDIGRISSNRPNWIGENDWQPMVNVWDTDEWRLKSKTAKENRDKSKSGKHTAGSRSFLHTKIVMEKKKGRKVKLVELHTAVHTKKGTKPGEPGSSGILEFVDPISKQRLDEYSKIISEKHNENEENTEIDENGSKSPPYDFEVWKGVGTSNIGYVLGDGFTTDPTFVLT
ncbi:transposase, Ptta/En/Spm, partial [Tanacetum coccineum]